MRRTPERRAGERLHHLYITERGGDRLEGIVTGVVVGAIVAIVGALGNYLASSRRDERQRVHERETQRERWEREDRIRYHEARLTAYRNTYNAVSSENLGFFRSDPTGDFLFARETFENGMQEIFLLHAEVLLLAVTEEVRNASVKINRELFFLSRKVQELPNGTTVRREVGGRLLDDVLEAGSEFLWAARSELGIDNRENR
jgi:hypothetical protein